MSNKLTAHESKALDIALDMLYRKTTPEDLIKHNKTLVIQLAEVDTAVREIARPHLNKIQIEGDQYWIPTLEEVVQALADQIPESKLQKATN